MAEARSRDSWGHTSTLLALIANVHRDPHKTRAFKPADFNPHAPARAKALPKVGIRVLKNVFVERQLGREA